MSHQVTFSLLYTSGAQTFWLVGYICLSETLHGPQELIINKNFLKNSFK